MDKEAIRKTLNNPAKIDFVYPQAWLRELLDENAALLETLREIEDESSTHDYSITAINGMAQDALTQYDTAPKEDKADERDQTI